jgi:LexA-binding, inner membrane-associated putative hydrolase
MFLGHYAIGFGGRGRRPGRPGPSLGTWFLAVQWLDLVWPVFVVSGIEHLRLSSSRDPFLRLEFTDYPWSHSLLAAVAWAALFGAAYAWRTRDRRGALWFGAAVVSHWVLDLIVHVPDLPLYPGGSLKLGFGLWRSVPWTLAWEGTLITTALIWYVRRTRARDRTGRWALWGLVAFLAAAYVASVVGPPPPSEMTVAQSALLLWALAPWAYWIDRHRATVG